MDDQCELELSCRPIGHAGKAWVVAKFPDGAAYNNKVDLANPTARKNLCRELCKGRKGIDRNAVAAELEKLAAKLMESPASDQKAGRRPSQADVLVSLCSDLELFHTSGGYDAEAFATFDQSGHKETWPLGSKGFRFWLTAKFWQVNNKVPGGQAIEDALGTLRGKALLEGPTHPVHIRLAELHGAIYLDLANDAWEVVEVTAGGWRLIGDPPVKFVRKQGQFPLPNPIRGTRLDELRPLLNLPNDSLWHLYVAWLVAALRPGRPFPILCVNGEQGTAKSTLCKMAKALIDPSKSAARRPPRDERDLMIAAANSWIVAYENLSRIRADFSDGLCALATGGGYSTRELFSDADEKLFDAMRPIMINGIEDLATRGDLLDRCVILMLPTIPDENRREEAELWESFERIRPGVLGALLDAVSAALRNKRSVALTSKPRMADFATWVVAAEPALGWPEGTFLAAYNANRNTTHNVGLDSSILTSPVFALVEANGIWQGTARELLAELATHASESIRKTRDWPTSARSLSGELRRLAPNLRKVGIDLSFPGHTKKGNLVRLERTGNAPSPSSPGTSKVTGRSTTDNGEHDEGGIQSNTEIPETEEIVEWTG
jgi:hypothetical protein